MQFEPTWLRRQLQIIGIGLDIGGRSTPAEELLKIASYDDEGLIPRLQEALKAERDIIPTPIERCRVAIFYADADDLRYFAEQAILHWLSRCETESDVLVVQELISDLQIECDTAIEIINDEETGQ